MKKAKYQLDKDLKFLENQALFPCIYVYPLVNLFIGMITCKSDENVSVRKVKTPGYNGQKLTTLIIEPRDSAGSDDKLPCMVFYHGGGILLKAVQSHYQFAKWYAAKFADYLKSNKDNDAIYTYPKTERLSTEDGRQFFDS